MTSMISAKTFKIGSFNFPNFQNVPVPEWEFQLQQAFEKSKFDFDSIVNNEAAPTLHNTLLAMEELSREISASTDPFFAITGAHTTPEVEEVIERWTSNFSEFSTQMYQNEKLYQRFASLDAQFKMDPKALLEANDIPESIRQYKHLESAIRQILKENMMAFTSAGIALNDEGQKRLIQINKDLVAFHEKFNRSNQKNSSESTYLNESEVDGLPQEVKEEAFALAEKEGRLGDYAFARQPMFVETLLPSMTHRLGRKKLVDGCVERGYEGVVTGETIRDIMRLREEKAAILGFEKASDMLLEDSMATAITARKLLDDTWGFVKPALDKELDLLGDLARKDGIDELWPSDIVYYMEKYRQENYQINEREVAEYLSLPIVRGAAFEVASKLFGISFTKVEVPLHVPDACAYLVTDNKDGAEVGIFIVDDHMRPEKRSGAWMTDIRSASYLNNERVLPWVMNVCNFEKNKEDRPALLTLEDAVTVFHELGHGLHSLLTQTPFPSLAGTRVARDFVELPSQILENWIRSPESLKEFARHYKTGESIPDELVEKIEAAAQFGVALARSRYLFSSYLDLTLHTQSIENHDWNDLEKNLRKELNIPENIFPRHRLPHFSHVFSDSAYASSYYCYLWAEVLEASAFARFKNEGLFNENAAQQLKELIFETGGSVPPQELFFAFTGKEFNPQDLLIRDGLVSVSSPNVAPPALKQKVR